MCRATQDIENEMAGDNSTIKQIGKKKKLAHSSAETVSAWKCYRCNLIFHEESLVLLHEDISNHSAVRVEYDYGSPRLIKESLGLVVETLAN